MTDNPGGIEAVIMTYYRSLNRSDFAFDFLSNNSRMAYEDEVSERGGRIFRVTPRHLSVKKFYQDLDLFFATHAEEFDAVWVNVCSLANIAYLSVAKKYGIKKRIIHCHNAQNGEGIIRGVLHRINRRRIRSLATDFWSCSNEASEWFYGKDYKEIPHYRYIPNTIDVQKYAFDSTVRLRKRAELGISDDLFVLGNVARFEHQKNHKALVQVFKQLHKMNDKYRLLLVGQGSLESEMRELVKQEGLETSVIFAGVRTDVDELYQAMDAFVLSSLFEGLPISALEAQANGLPCILSTGCPSSCFVNGNTLSVDFSSDSGQIAKKMNDWFLDLPEQRVDASTIQNSEYSIENQIHSFEKAIDGR
ncbi:glycosyltransferase family 1 protein [Alloscardovia criceti]|uniref:glycosyltransferase family 1 protein n=1 Tax=Alloscardovia criceti TaxID=356828 RepID=UPI0012EAFA3B|nr:glycosyltransferase family 1 protein [Alloscardovia criceti]